MKVRATQAILECLLEQEVDTVFGYPGGTILNLYDELYHYQDKNGNWNEIDMNDYHQDSNGNWHYQK